MLADVTLAQYALVAAVAFGAAVIGGVTGYGGGLLLPPILVPLIGAEAVVPVLGLGALLTNASRLLAFRSEFDLRRAMLVTAWALPTCILGAWGYTRLSGPGVAVLIGVVLIVLVPARRILTRRRGHLSTPGVAAAGAGYGLLVGGTSGIRRGADRDPAGDGIAGPRGHRHGLRHLAGARDRQDDRVPKRGSTSAVLLGDGAADRHRRQSRRLRGETSDARPVAAGAYQNTRRRGDRRRHAADRAGALVPRLTLPRSPTS